MTKRENIIAYVAPEVRLFPTKFALVFGTRHGVPQFAEETCALYRQGYFTNLVISGGATGQNDDSEASVLYEAIVSRGIPENVLRLEDKAMHTGQNVVLTRQEIKGFGIEELLLIGKISSKRRYIMTVRQQWPEIARVCCHGVNYFSVSTHQWWKDQEFRVRVLSECRKIPTYIKRGFISEVRIVNGVVL
jgi:hypothetical protein